MSNTRIGPEGAHREAVEAMQNINFVMVSNHVPKQCSIVGDRLINAATALAALFQSLDAATPDDPTLLHNMWSAIGYSTQEANDLRAELSNLLSMAHALKTGVIT